MVLYLALNSFTPSRDEGGRAVTSVADFRSECSHSKSVFSRTGWSICHPCADESFGGVFRWLSGEPEVSRMLAYYSNRPWRMIESMLRLTTLNIDRSQQITLYICTARVCQTRLYVILFSRNRECHDSLMQWSPTRCPWAPGRLLIHSCVPATDHSTGSM